VLDIVERLKDKDAVVLAGLHHAIPAMRDAAMEIERLRAALEPVKTIYAAAPDSASQADSFGKGGCPLTPAQIREMQAAIGITYIRKE
jgi:hypothetical protein